MSTDTTTTTPEARRGAFLAALPIGAVFAVAIEQHDSPEVLPAWARLATKYEGYSIVFVAADQRGVASDISDLSCVTTVVLWNDGRATSACHTIPDAGHGYVRVADDQDGVNLQETDPEAVAFGVGEDSGDAEAIAQEPEHRKTVHIDDGDYGPETEPDSEKSDSRLPPNRPIPVFGPAADIVEMAAGLRAASFEFGSRIDSPRYSEHHNTLCDALDGLVGFLVLLRVTPIGPADQDAAPTLLGTHGNA